MYHLNTDATARHAADPLGMLPACFCDSSRHAIYAYLSTGVKVRVSPFMGWENATRVFYECELSAGNRIEQKRLVVGDFAGTVKHFAVRNADDPNWPREQPPHDVTTADDRDHDVILDFVMGDRHDLPLTVPAC